MNFSCLQMSSSNGYNFSVNFLVHSEIKSCNLSLTDASLRFSRDNLTKIESKSSIDSISFVSKTDIQCSKNVTHKNCPPISIKEIKSEQCWWVKTAGS